MFVTSQVSMPAASHIKYLIKTLKHMPRSLQYEIQVNNLVLCSWLGKLPLCWCQASCVCIIIVCHPSLCHCYTTDEPYLALVDVDTLLYIGYVAYNVLLHTILQ